MPQKAAFCHPYGEKSGLAIGLVIYWVYGRKHSEFAGS